ncbi:MULTISPECIES: TIGR01244 family sulfur transferase [unclassified Paracoccus (in: a-proteobacteria)]|uniref:TIGR01244 family sulfur transferase n=1 Tax=unclassified Paracoccus (in: a-proteobacteria) TaxID=2688777 RepID=UPI0012B3F651|nr:MULTISPECIES: TIGR01244 family sulfur transferase [unclassified Paracoccus (in: a-proteobacteria)]UXU74549.1 TIGR01244 family sulfur transferase [Paracoccus sp. SMMA_5]UXU80441.1 TIGR01244 family sulfur transferase [Paracoccus sp. SMMA_5_TC]
MDLRQLTPDLAVSAQIRPEDVPALADAGFRVLINNRPDAEVGEDENDAAMRKAAEDAGLSYFYIPFSPGQVTPDMITAQAEALSAPGPKVAYCRSGNRSTVLWALTRAGQQPIDELMQAAARAGHDIAGIRPLIETLARRPA